MSAAIRAANGIPPGCPRRSSTWSPTPIAYGQSGKAVQITIDGEGRDDVVVKVHNHGPAMPADLIPVLFEPFRRGVPQDRSPGGLGLGLYIVQQIVLAHDGKIDVESTEKEGTTFTLRLPRQRRPDAAPG